MSFCFVNEYNLKGDHGISVYNFFVFNCWRFSIHIIVGFKRELGFTLKNNN